MTTYNWLLLCGSFLLLFATTILTSRIRLGLTIVAITVFFLGLYLLINDIPSHYLFTFQLFIIGTYLLLLIGYTRRFIQSFRTRKTS